MLREIFVGMYDVLKLADEMGEAGVALAGQATPGGGAVPACRRNEPAKRNGASQVDSALGRGADPSGRRQEVSADGLPALTSGRRTKTARPSQ